MAVGTGGGVEAMITHFSARKFGKFTGGGKFVGGKLYVVKTAKTCQYKQVS